MKSALRVRHSKGGVNGIDLGIECSGRDRCCFIGFAFGNKIGWRNLMSYLCLRFWKNCSLNIMNYCYNEEILLIGTQITYSVDQRSEGR